MNNEFEFLGKMRFWTMVLAALMLYLEQKGLIGEEEALFIGGLSAAFWATQTVDRATERLGQKQVEATVDVVDTPEAVKVPH